MDCKLLGRFERVVHYSTQQTEQTAKERKVHQDASSEVHVRNLKRRLNEVVLKQKALASLRVVFDLGILHLNGVGAELIAR